MYKKGRTEKTVEKIIYWKNPLAGQVESRRLFRNDLANDFIDCADWPANVTRAVIMKA